MTNTKAAQQLRSSFDRLIAAGRATDLMQVDEALLGLIAPYTERDKAVELGDDAVMIALAAFWDTLSDYCAQQPQRTRPLVK